VKRLHELMNPPAPSDRRGLASQCWARQQETLVRQHVVAFAHWTETLGWSLPDTAERLHLSPRTLSSWCARCRSQVPLLVPLGRRTARSPRAERMAVLEVLDELGPAVSVATLRECFPALTRAELADLLKRYRHVWRQRHQQVLHVLHWQIAGAVWAMDFAEAPRPIEGRYPYLLAVRDLASHQQLAWQPVTAATAAETLATLRPLLLEHGAPLVLKTDNGSAFIAEALRDYLLPLEVSLLFSPPHTPRYNGSIEAGIGSLKTRTERQATRAGHPTIWTFDDVALARLEANATARPRGETGPTPDELWSQRRPLTTVERHLFAEAVQRQRATVNIQEGVAQDVLLPAAEERRLQRAAIRRALEERDILLFSRRRIPLPITSSKTASIM
jgi:transposase InsO family protein